MGLKTAAALVAALVLTACANGYSQFYKPAQGATPEALAGIRVSGLAAQPDVERAAPPGNEAARMVDAYAKRGYIVIGTSFFNSGHNESENAAVQQGVKVGADLVLILNPRYTGSTTTAVPFTTPTTSTTYSSGTATAYGPGGVVNAYGSGTSTTYGSQTTMIPITVNRSDYGAVYFIKRKWSFGALWRDLSDSERQELQSNKGVAVRVLVDNSPAYQADVLPGDIILTVNGETVLNQQSMQDLLRKFGGTTVKVGIYRHGARLEKDVQLLPA